MYHVTISFDEELNFFLQGDLRKRVIQLSFSGKRSIKDLIECLGIPHVEVDLIYVNGLSVDFSYIVNDCDIIKVYSDFDSMGETDSIRLKLPHLTDTGFVLDVHLGKLARDMRLLGFDVDYAGDRDDTVLADISHRENRILLTCDRQLLMRKIISRGIIIRSRDPEVQIIEVIERLHLQNLINPFTRCIECNGMIESIDMQNADIIKETGKIPAGVLSWCKDYFVCTTCRKIYWKGSHYDKLFLKLEKILKRLGESSTVRQ